MCESWIKHGDMRVLIKDIDDESIDLIVTDPPYRITSRGNSGTMGGVFKKDISLKGKVFIHNNIDVREYAGELYRVLKSGSHCYIMTNHKNLQNFINTFTKVGFIFIKSLIWNKGNKIASQFYMSQFEYILFFRKGKAKKINNCGTSDIISVPNIKTKDKDGKNLHDTEKPVELMKILIENSSQQNDLILDPFIGIGSTPIACVETHRNYIGFELDENYFNIAYKRITNTVYRD